MITFNRHFIRCIETIRPRGGFGLRWVSRRPAQPHRSNAHRQLLHDDQIMDRVTVTGLLLKCLEHRPLQQPFGTGLAIALETQHS